MIAATLLDSMGSDLTVVNAARVSFAKQSAEFADRDAKLIAYLAKHEHWSPFAHCIATFHVKAPIFVARQLMRHVVGLAVNEVSRRYVDSEPEFYVPDAWRKRAENAKQGSSDEALDGVDHHMAETWFTESIQDALDTYVSLVRAGVCPEQARMVLPLATFTEWHWTGSLAAFARVCRQRLDPHAQAETRIVAQQISDAMTELFPVSWPALMRDGP